jgi:ribosomal protein S18 acetylase RimI-like enzyme
MSVRTAQPEDAEAIGRLLHEFNLEFGDFTPGPEKLAKRARALIEGDELVALLGGEGPDGVAILRLRPSVWSDALECYVAELYVVPARRGRGLGRALMTAALELARERGADHVELATSEDDVAARALYESLGFSNRDDGAVMLFYERPL